MPQLKTKNLREQNPEQLRDKLFELRGDVSKLKSSAARGMIQKDSGKIRRTKRDIARVLTILREKGEVE